MKRLRYSRRELFSLAGAAAASSALAACGSSDPVTHHKRKPTTLQFRSRPNLHPPIVRLKGDGLTPDTGYIFITPGGPMILDVNGDPVWYRPVDVATMDLQVQQYQGQPVLTWWQGQIRYGVGATGKVVVLDSHYKEVTTLEGAHGLQPDLHEFVIAADGTGYYTSYQVVTADLSAIGGPTSGKMLEAWIQGVDLGTGNVVFEWRSSDHIALSETYRKYSSGAPFTPVHLNSIDPLPDGNLLVSARHTWTIYKIDRATGAILWRMGGKQSDFALGTGVHFAWQHDARWHPGNVLTMFDNESPPPEAKQSRGLVLQVTETKKTVTFLHAYDYPGELMLSGSQGSVQFLPSGDVFVGWGSHPYFTQYHHDGKAVLVGTIEQGTSYRAFRVPWTGTPDHRPAIAVERRSGDHLRVYASWNGATEVARWSVVGGSSRHALSELGRTDRSGFETSIDVTVPPKARFVAARAIDATGKVLATSPVTKI